MSALQKNSSSKSSSKKSTSSKSAKKDNGAAPKKAKGKTSPKAKAKFAGSLAVAVKPSPPQAPKPPVQAAKPKTKDAGIGDAASMGKAAASPMGATKANPAPTLTGGGAGAAKGAKSEASKASKKITGKKPSKMLKAYKGLGKAVTAGKKKDEKKAHSAIPDFHAVMPGDAAMKGKGKDQKPNADKTVDDKVPGAEAKAPKLAKQKKGKGGRQKVDGKSNAEMKRLAALENALDAMKKMFGAMTSGITTDSNVNTDPGPSPEIVFSGSSNPQRAKKADAEADTKMNEGHDKFAKAIDDGKQPSDVKRLEMDQVVKAVKNSDLKIGEEQLQKGEKYYEKLVAQHTTKEIDGADKRLEVDVQPKMAKATKDMDKSLEKQETDRQAGIEKAKSDIDAQNTKAKDEQEKLVDKSKKDIAKAQKNTRKKQDLEVKKAKRKGDKEKKKVEKDIDQKEKKDEKKIDSEYTKAEKKAEGEEKKAETKARKKKKEAEKKKKEQSWWDRVKSAVSDFVDSVCSAIGSIFDALGSLVSGILNAVKDLACAIIDEAIKWAKKALDGLGSLLKGLVNGLIGDIFPGLAKELNGLIDSGIDLAKKGCDVVGEKLKEGVTAAVDTVNAVVQKGLQVVKVGLQTAVRVTGCIATGDFEGAFLATLYGALEIAGISKSDADKMLGDAKETLKLIVDDFGGFAGNLIGAAGDGFSNFGKNFMSHFTSAVTGWLLGPVAAAGLEAPEKWDAQGIFGMVLGVLGVSTDSLKEQATERIGEDNMAALEKGMEYVMSFVEGGFEGLWEQAKNDLGNIWDLVLGMVTDYITKKVVQFGMEQLASLMAGPFGALYQALKTAWGIYCTVRDKINEIKEVLSAIFSSISDIARGNTKKASTWVENALQKVLGIAIDLGANLAGIGDIPDKIRGFVEGLQERVKTAIGKAMDWVLEKVKGLFSPGGKEDEKKEPDATEDESKQDNGRKVAQLPGATIASTLGAITINYGAPSGAGAPPVLQSTGVIAGALRAKGLPGLEKDIKKADKSPAQSKALENMKHAKGVAMGLENKGQRYLAGEDNLAEARKTMDLMAAHILEAASFAGGLNKRDDGVDVLPAPYKFKSGDGHDHTIFVRREGAKAQLTVRSVETPIKDKIKDWKKDLDKLSKDDKKKAGGFIGKAIAMEKVADGMADKLAGLAAGHADIPKLTADIEAKVKETAVELGNLFGLFGKPPQQWVPAVHNPWLHPNYIQFRDRALSLDPPMGMSEIKKLWSSVLTAAGIASEAQAKEKAGTVQSKDAAELLRDKARGQYKTVASVMLKDRFELAKAGGKGYALWSGGAITMEFAFGKGYTALEKTDAGKLFDNLSVLNDNWDAEKILWEELSRQYAAMPEIGKIHAFQRWQGAVFSKIEKPEIIDRAKKTKSASKLWWHYHSIVGEKFFASQDLNKKYGLKGPQKSSELIDLGETYDESSWQGKLDKHDQDLEKEMSGGMPSGAPPDTTALVALIKVIDGGGPQVPGWMDKAADAAELYKKLYPTLPKSEQFSMPDVGGAIEKGLGTIDFKVENASQLATLCTQAGAWADAAFLIAADLRGGSGAKKVTRAATKLEDAAKVGALASALDRMKGDESVERCKEALAALTTAWDQTGYPYEKPLKTTLQRIVTAWVVKLTDDLKTRIAVFHGKTEMLWGNPKLYEDVRDRNGALLTMVKGNTLSFVNSNRFPAAKLKAAAEVLQMEKELGGALAKMPANVRFGNDKLNPKHEIEGGALGAAKKHMAAIRKAMLLTKAKLEGTIKSALEKEAKDGVPATTTLSKKEANYVSREAALAAFKGFGALSPAGLAQLISRVVPHFAKSVWKKVTGGSKEIQKAKKKGDRTIEKSSILGNLARLGGLVTILASGTITGRIVGGSIACLGRMFISMKSGRGWKKSFLDGIIEASVFAGMPLLVPWIGKAPAMIWGAFGIVGSALSAGDALYGDAQMLKLQLNDIEKRLAEKQYAIPETLSTPVKYLEAPKNG